MIAGLSFQVFSLLLFMLLCADFALRIRKLPEPQRDNEYQSLRRMKLFKGFLLGEFIMLLEEPLISTAADPLLCNSSGHRHSLHLHSMLLSSRGASVRLRRSLSQ